MELVVKKPKFILHLCVSYGYDYEWIVQTLSVKRFMPVFQYILQSIGIFNTLNNKQLTLKLVTF